MRSRYSAYVEGALDYLRQSWHPSTRLDMSEPLQVRTWLGLKIVLTEEGTSDHETGVVEFVARYRDNGRGARLRETSRFIREGGRWYYLDGDITNQDGSG